MKKTTMQIQGKSKQQKIAKHLISYKFEKKRLLLMNILKEKF